ncbi:small ribosomal subunit Rsm22 family protein [Kiritimatiellota bacterium B12222]|nr:small ribosomal subunit Rsm22 family protein [Kiritimatiellota bacterium B12222]
MKNEPPKIDWDRLRELRDLFLQPEPITGPYWKSNRQLQDYDITLGERIGWKWDAVLEELKVRGWKPPSPSLTDMGCGTGVATRRMLRAFPGHFKKVTLWDHSEAAISYARQKLRHEFPDVRVICPSAPPHPKGVVLISHVLTELNDESAGEFLELMADAQAMLWVEPGTFETSRMLIEVREMLREEFKVVAPCTHQERCGILAQGNENHWCHHFANAPAKAHQDPFWGHFRKEMNLDVGPLAYSFLILEKEPELIAEGASHLIGKPMIMPKYVRVLSCQKEDVRELVAGRKTDGYRDLKQGVTPMLYRFELKKNRILSGKKVGEAAGTDH